MFRCSKQEMTITPEKNGTVIEEQDHSLKNMLSPFLDCLIGFQVQIKTPLKKQPQILESPSSIKRDLFTQLLATDNKNTSCSGAKCSMQNELFQEGLHESQMIRQSDEQDQSYLSSINSSEDNQIRKRKRKSTVQIKMLRQELNGQMNWTKEKIVHMAEVTGLSQSQVYKWCWDQKKKNTKVHKEEYRLCRRKIIRKDILSRAFQIKHQNNKNHTNQFRSSSIISELPYTEKKISKKLVFY